MRHRNNPERRWHHFGALLLLLGTAGGLLWLILSPGQAQGLLQNGGFEEGLTGWIVPRGALALTSDPAYVHGGSFAGALTTTGMTTAVVYQSVNTAPCLRYTFAGYVYKNDSNIASVLLRLSWRDGRDGTGWELATDDSAPLTPNSPSYQELTTSSISPPARTLSVRAQVVVFPSGGPSGTVYLDDLALQGTPTDPSGDSRCFRSFVPVALKEASGPP